MSQNVFNKKQLFKKVPILDWLPKYNVQTGVSDLIAGITVGLTIIPQGIAYALVANLPPQVSNLYFFIKTFSIFWCFCSHIPLIKICKPCVKRVNLSDNKLWRRVSQHPMKTQIVFGLYFNKTLEQGLQIFIKGIWE